jgi:hypothetical protein
MVFAITLEYLHFEHYRFIKSSNSLLDLFVVQPPIIYDNSILRAELLLYTDEHYPPFGRPIINVQGCKGVMKTT